MATHTLSWVGSRFIPSNWTVHALVQFLHMTLGISDSSYDIDIYIESLASSSIDTSLHCLTKSFRRPLSQCSLENGDIIVFRARRRARLASLHIRPGEFWPPQQSYYSGPLEAVFDDMSMMMSIPSQSVIEGASDLDADMLYIVTLPNWTVIIVQCVPLEGNACCYERLQYLSTQSSNKDIRAIASHIARSVGCSPRAVELAIARRFDTRQRNREEDLGDCGDSVNEALGPATLSRQESSNTSTSAQRTPSRVVDQSVEWFLRIMGVNSSAQTRPTCSLHSCRHLRAHHHSIRQTVYDVLLFYEINEKSIGTRT